MNFFLSIENLDWFWRAALIQLTTFLLLIFSFIDFSFVINVTPFFLLISIFYWSVYRPSIFPPIMIFCVGIIQSLIFEYPVGLHSILYLSIYFLITRQRIFLMGQSYLNLWLFFSLTVFLYIILEWLFFSIRYFHVADFQISILSSVVTIFLYPILSLLLIFLNRLLSAVSPADS